MNIINPATGRMVDSVSDHTYQEISESFERARAAQPGWSAMPLADRSEVIERFVGLLEENKNKLAEDLTTEVGKPLNQSLNEINGAIARINYFIEHGPQWLEPETMLREAGQTERIVYESLGIVANISAWNYPFLVGVNVFVPALLAGNAVMYKPSEFANLTGRNITSLWHKAGIPEDIFEVVYGGAPVGQALLDLPLDGYFFTGSFKTGNMIYQQVAPKMVPCGLELGGKDPLYVMEQNSDIAQVAAAVADGAFYNAGQSCCAVERIYVHDKNYDAFVSAFLDTVNSYVLGDPMDEETYIGPLTREAQVQVLEAQVADAVVRGAQCVLGGKPVRGFGNFFEPTVLLDVDHTMKVMKEESFGPIIGIQKVSSDDEAVRLMNDTKYGLTAAVYADDETHALPLLEQLNAGTVYFNCCDRVSPYVPWSGRGHSGFGSTLSHMGTRAFTRPKAYQLRS